MAYFRKVVDDEGNETFEEVDFSNEELDLSIIPDERFYEDGRYKEVADRDYSRRQKLKEAEERLKALQASDEDEDTSQDNSDDSVDAETVGMTPEQIQALIEQREADMFSRLMDTINNRQKEEQEKEQRIVDILRKNELPDDMREILEATDDPEKVAKSLARHTKKFSSGDSTGDSKGSLSDRLNAVNKRLGLE